MKVFVRSAIHPDAVALLRADTRIETVTWDEPGIDAWPEEADAVIIRGLTMREGDIRRCRKLKVIGRHGAGVDAVDLEVAKALGVKVINTPYENSQSVAELAVAFMLASGRRMIEANACIREGKWDAARTGKNNTELFRHTAGFVGFGRIARMVATILRAFSMKLKAYDPFITGAQWEEMRDFVTPCKTVEELFASCTYISIHVPKTKETQNLVNADIFKKAKKGLVLVNTARGGVVDETALYEAMKDGIVKAAAFDVFASEPLDPENPLLSMPGFIATPHYAGSTEECLQRVATACARETAAALFHEENPEYRYL